MAERCWQSGNKVGTKNAARLLSRSLNKINMKLILKKQEAEKFIADRHGKDYQVSIEMEGGTPVNSAPVITAAGRQLSYTSIATVEILKASNTNGLDSNLVSLVKLIRVINPGLGLQEARDAVYNISMAINYIHLHNSLNGFKGIR
jgi:hypothetical protein